MEDLLEHEVDPQECRVFPQAREVQLDPVCRGLAGAVHICALRGQPEDVSGKKYARLKILVFLHNLVKMFRWEKLLSDEKIVVNPMPMPATGIPVHLCPHKA
ncbi:hypothetical protein BT93_C1143 [Corymbia citriodora subsp. variegata]|nr:hypothetical protein BT93_C1143 [Corymbia citriodora subsp. variegata]